MPSPRPPADLQVHPFPMGGETLVLVSFPVEPDPTGGVDLSPVQREIFEMLLRGHTSAEIARHRGRSPSTIRKQVGALYRALGVSGRSEFLGRFVRVRAR